MVVIDRTNNRIRFGRTSPLSDYEYQLFPFYITSPNDPPRAVLHEFPDPNPAIVRRIINEDKNRNDERIP